MEDIYMEYDLAGKLKDDMIDHTDIIVSDMKKLQSLLGDLNEYWQASAATKFTINVDGYIDIFSRYAGYYQDLADKLGLSKQTYQDFDTYFLEKNI